MAMRPGEHDEEALDRLALSAQRLVGLEPPQRPVRDEPGQFLSRGGAERSVGGQPVDEIRLTSCGRSEGRPSHSSGSMAAIHSGAWLAAAREHGDVRFLPSNGNLYHPRMRDMPWHTFALGSLLLISVFSKGGQDVQSPQPEQSKPPVKTEQRGRILGIGGVFFKSANRDQTREWYSKHLGLADKGGGAMLPWREHDDPQKEHVTVWTVFPKFQRLLRSRPRAVHDQLHRRRYGCVARPLEARGSQDRPQANERVLRPLRVDL